ncbi:hypothetical protein OG799_16295 [Micromonospora sp. NBC_00898]|uniref:hypothetical protein n=1 Tax=Micromonospora sp. NBC_00898 TaxID=2975981 RepID=UPI00386B455B|nr:hypothetical protein OG799_16295 [Micromonospora sp. NBC_00898]
MRILKGSKSRYYGAALRYFEHAKRCYRQADQPAEWQQVAWVRQSGSPVGR